MTAFCASKSRVGQQDSTPAKERNQASAKPSTVGLFNKVNKQNMSKNMRAPIFWLIWGNLNSGFNGYAMYLTGAEQIGDAALHLRGSLTLAKHRD